jgi:hypothetical protein
MDAPDSPGDYLFKAARREFPESCESALGSIGGRRLVSSPWKMMQRIVCRSVCV